MYQHEKTIQELEINISDLPGRLRTKFGMFKGRVERALSGNNGVIPENTQNQLTKYSVVLSDEIIDWHEKDLPEEAEETKKTEYMKSLIERAKTLGLPETATEQEIVAAETTAKEAGETAEKLKARALAVGLAETATEQEIVNAESGAKSAYEIQQALMARAKAVGLSEKASEAEIIAAETKSKAPKSNSVLDTMFGW